MDWAAALLRLRVSSLEDNPQAVMDSLVCLLKTREDSEAMSGEIVERMVARAV